MYAMNTLLCSMVITVVHHFLHEGYVNKAQTPCIVYPAFSQPFKLSGIQTIEQGFVTICSDSDNECETDSRMSYKPVTCMGHHPDSDVFVVGPTQHFRGDGNPIPIKYTCGCLRL